jgi:hypothetical protein
LVVFDREQAVVIDEPYVVPKAVLQDVEYEGTTYDKLWQFDQWARDHITDLENIEQRGKAISWVNVNIRGRTEIRDVAQRLGIWEPGADPDMLQGDIALELLDRLKFEQLEFSRTYVAPHKRVTKDGVVDVEGYWRDIADTTNSPEGETPAMLGYVKKRWGSWAKKNATILEIYQGGEYEDMNNILRGNDEFLSLDRELIQRDNDELRKALDEAPRTSKDMVVWRGGVGHVLHELGVEEGDTFTDPAFVSTSLTSTFAGGFGWLHPTGQDVVEIRMPKGTTGGYNVENGQEDFGEMEFILQAGTQFKIVKKPAPGDADSHPRSLGFTPGNHWVLEVIVDGGKG